MVSGTLLGAVRHGGHIPWDDDADVALLRGEYEKFRNACETELDHTRFVFQDHRNTPGYRWGYGKLRRKATLFLREYQEHMPYMQGIFIDIFPLDNVLDKAWGYYRRWYEDSADIVFEGITFQGIWDWDGYRAFKFGDYMNLPPEEKWKVHPVTELKLL